MDKHKRPLDSKDDDQVKFSKVQLLQMTLVRIGKVNPQGIKSSMLITKKFYGIKISLIAKSSYDPFQILQRIDEVPYRIKLLEHWHNAFHVSLPKPFKGTPPLKAFEEDPTGLMNKRRSYNLRLFLKMKISSFKVVRLYASI